MVTFLSLFLGLVTGTQPVALAVGSEVARVEIRLDGRTIGRLARAPWVLAVDFGTAPEPHHLEATAFDTEGVEVARAMQRVNLPRSLAEATLLLEPGAGGTGRVALLTWQSALAERPERVRVTFDGAAIPAPDPSRIALPAFVPEQLHFLRADLDFPAQTSASTEITFGGQSRDRTQAELTAIAVLPERKSLPPAPEMNGWFLANGTEVKVVASEEGLGEVAIILDEAARGALAKLVESYRPAPAVPGLMPVNRAWIVSQLRKGQRARFQWTFPQVHEVANTRFLLFPHSREFTRSDGGLLWVLTHVFPPGMPEERRFADAVAVAGLDVSARSRPRAVLLILAGSKESSLLTPAGARHFLSRLGVPLFVWSVGAGARDAAAWGGATDVSRPSSFEEAATRLTEFVDRQRVVWLEGAHLPQSIALSEKAAGLSLAR